MASTVGLAEAIDERGDDQVRRSRIRPLLQKFGTTISLVAGAIAFCGFTFALVAGDADVSFEWPSFALVLLPSVAALSSLSQGETTRKLSIPVLIGAAAELIIVAGTFLRDAPESEVTVTTISVVLFAGGLGLLTHIGAEPGHDRDVQILVGLIAAWFLFAGSMAMFVFGHTEIIVPLGLGALAVVVLHILNDDPTALRRRSSRS